MVSAWNDMVDALLEICFSLINACSQIDSLSATPKMHSRKCVMAALGSTFVPTVLDVLTILRATEKYPMTMFRKPHNLGSDIHNDIKLALMKPWPARFAVFVFVICHWIDWVALEWIGLIGRKRRPRRCLLLLLLQQLLLSVAMLTRR